MKGPWNIDNPLTDDGRNKINEMFQELYNEYREAGFNAKEARNKAEQAVSDALIAKETAEVTRKEMLEIIREQTRNGDLAPEIAQARGDKATLGERLNSVDSQLAQTKEHIGVSVWEYEHLIPNKDTALNSNEWDWTEAIKASIQKAYETGLGKVLFKHYGTGDYLTDPISFEGYEGITLIGIGAQVDLNPNYRWGDENRKTKHVRLKFKAQGEVGLQFADTANPNPQWNAPQCKVENIWVCGNNLVETCINGNYGLTLKNVWTSHAINDGVVFEDYTFPALIEDSQLGPNGRHGLFVKGPMTTVFTLRRVNASLNGGYGYLVIGGSSATFNDCLAQSNSQGGLKITKRNDLYGHLTNNYLNKLTFNNFYTEANGKLEETDPLYEGNYALVIDYTEEDNVTGQRQARNITFNGGALNASQNGGTYNIVSVFGLEFNGISVDHSKGRVNSNAATGLRTTTSPTVAGANAPYPFANSFLEINQGNVMLVHQNGVLSNRGRVTSIPFVLDNLTAGESAAMKLANSEKENGWFTHGYPVSKGSLVGVKLFMVKSKKTTQNVSGSIKLSITSNEFEDETVGLTYMLQDILTLDLNNERYKEIWFKPLEHSLSDNFVGLRVFVSQDYTNNTNYPTLFGYLLIEE